MKHKNIFKIALFFLLAMGAEGIYGQTIIYSQDFETNLNGYSHTPSQTPSTDPGDQYFHRAEPRVTVIFMRVMLVLIQMLQGVGCLLVLIQKQ